MALDHLVANGRQRIAMIDTVQMDSPRREAYRDHLTEYGLHWSPASEARAEESHRGGITAVSALLDQHPEMDAILAYNDLLAVGALKGLAHAGIAVPEGIAVIGIDGLDVGEMISPELTSLAIDKAELARHTVELLETLIDATAPKVLNDHRTLSYSLILRESVWAVGWISGR